MDGLVYDFSNGQHAIWPAEIYYDLGKVQNTKRYSFDQATKNLVEIGHYGPWE